MYDMFKYYFTYASSMYFKKILHFNFYNFQSSNKYTYICMYVYIDNIRICLLQLWFRRA